MSAVELSSTQAVALADLIRAVPYRYDFVKVSEKLLGDGTIFVEFENYVVRGSRSVLGSWEIGVDARVRASDPQVKAGG